VWALDLSTTSCSTAASSASKKNRLKQLEDQAGVPPLPRDGPAIAQQIAF